MPNRRMFALQVVVVVFLLVFAWIAVYVDDWSRDLTTNTASTSDESRDERLRPIATQATADAVRTAASDFAEANPHWRIAEERALPTESPLALEVPAPRDVIHLVRTTGLVRYNDDVWLVVEGAPDNGLRVHAHSQSRVGKGDLGQNPRNLRELLDALRAALK